MQDSDQLTDYQRSQLSRRDRQTHTIIQVDPQLADCRLEKVSHDSAILLKKKQVGLLRLQAVPVCMSIFCQVGNARLHKTCNMVRRVYFAFDAR